MAHTLTYLEKCDLYNAGQYVCEVPMSCHAYWTTDDWIKWIDYCNGWAPTPKGEQE